MVFEEKTVSSEKIFDGQIIKVRVDTVEMPDGKLATRELVDHPGGVGIVALTENNEIIMVKQFRKPIERAIYEVPAGKLDGGEDHYICGVRELEEETGFKAKNFEYLGFMYPSPGFANEATYLYLATELYAGKMNLDPDEYLDVEYIPISKVKEMIMNNEINDAKTVFGVFKALELLENV
ncbi:MAG: NUDIX hydrolase [Oscillospiraceae bacterium]